MIYTFLAQGFEETEAITPIDILRRCGKKVITVGIGDNIITGSHGITIVADTEDRLIELNDELEMIVLPGGMPGTVNLEGSEIVQKAIDYCTANNLYIGAICAAPSILGHKGLLKGKKATCYTGFEQELAGAEVLSDPAVIDGKIITARGAGAAVEFGLALAEVLTSKEKSQKMGEALLWTRK
ncbi:MAG: DJ-1/PfpI family protein [Ruminococcus sp.]|nr:DJ-1/PfpI family protein [Ruminococcus sp.]MCM1382381.1 DJ-1/PfpI family protein [Muribaculaceae bacterium]MCM1479313.1 DJ-1/PfpI family protein [Muribaculaceae bacterium]